MKPKNAIHIIAAIGLLLPSMGLTQSDTTEHKYGGPKAGFWQLYGPDKSLTAYLGFRSAEQPGLGQLMLYHRGDPRLSLAVTPTGEGELLLRDANGRDKLSLGANANAGFFWLRGNSNAFTIKLDHVSTDRNKGRIQLYDNGDPRADLYVNNAGDGVLELRGLGGVDRLRAAIGAVTTAGEFPPGTPRQSKAGYLATYGDHGNWVALLGPRSINTYDHLGGGHLILRNRQGETTIQLNGQTGEIIGTTKSFAMPHPVEPAKQIVYAALEGPEAAAYVRGTATLVNGKAALSLPEHFSLIVGEQGMTVHLTPRSTASRGLAVVSSSSKEIVVGELGNGAGNYPFDYLVQGIRKGQEKFQVVREK